MFQNASENSHFIPITNQPHSIDSDSKIRRKKSIKRKPPTTQDERVRFFNFKCYMYVCNFD